MNSQSTQEFRGVGTTLAIRRFDGTDTMYYATMQHMYRGIDQPLPTQHHGMVHVLQRVSYVKVLRIQLMGAQRTKTAAIG